MDDEYQEVLVKPNRHSIWKMYLVNLMFVKPVFTKKKNKFLSSFNILRRFYSYLVVNAFQIAIFFR